MIIFDHEKLTDLLRRKGITWKKIALDTGISEMDLLRLKNGTTKNPRFETVEILAMYFKVNMETFKKEVK